MSDESSTNRRQRPWSTEELAAFLGHQPQTLRIWRVRGLGPQYVRVGHGRKGRVAYLDGDVQVWLAGRRYASTAEEGTKPG
jgi:hypothetical protein